MPEIGATLRETRMRERIDIAEVETATKIRAKYLRALENEEWDLLPGPTFIKTFLRTYGDYLGLDSKMLVEEYKQRFERVEASELMPFQGPLSGRRQRRAPVIPPFAIVAVVILGLLALLFWLGTQETDEPTTPNRVATPTPEATPAASSKKQRKRKRPAATPAVARLRIEATGTVNVCLVDATGRVLIRSQNLSAGSRTRTFRSRRFRVTFGNEFARVRVNGRAFKVPRSREAIGYEITSKRRRVLPAAQRPTCVS
jgi:cytoskeletal protein RodZ